jgi:hypothetical protein
MLFSASWVILEVEKNASGASIVTYEDALWWTLNVSSVGDTSLQPVTSKGKILGAGIIFVGVTIFALNTGLLSAIFSSIIKKSVLKELHYIEDKGIIEFQFLIFGTDA